MFIHIPIYVCKIIIQKKVMNLRGGIGGVGGGICEINILIENC